MNKLPSSKMNISVKNNIKNEELKPPTFKQSLYAFIFYIIVVIIIIPQILIKTNNKKLLLTYYPNVDLIATLLTFNGGFLPGNYFSELYSNTPKTRFGEVSQLFVNYIALLGVTYLIARHTIDKQSVNKGWSIGFVILFVTYLFPNTFVNKTLNYIYYDLFSKNKNIKTFEQEYTKQTFIQRYIKYLPTLLIGIIIVFGLIYIEGYIIENYEKHLSYISSFILKKLNYKE